MTKILVTGSGGSGGVSFIRALKYAQKQQKNKIFVVSTDHNHHFLNFPDSDVKVISPRHDDHTFVPLLLSLIKKHNVEFLHPHPSSEARVVSENLATFNKAGVKTYLPNPKSIMPDKTEIQQALTKKNVRVAKTVEVNSLADLDRAFLEIGKPLWIRARRGAGGRLGLKVDSAEEAKHWVELNRLQRRSAISDFIIQEYLPGRDLAFDSLWFNGRLVTSYGRERLEYFLKHISLSGITGTPTIAKTIVDEKVSDVGIKAVKALDPKPHGFFSTDIKEDVEGNCVVTEVDGKWHTTAPLWGYAFAKAQNKPELNLTYHYLKLALNNGETDVNLPNYNLFPADYFLVRQLDAGVILEHEGKSWRIV
jgi:glutathione synthase/RimK-type ligase-like ATP-grasp enzyme